ncbi:hypothetical protein PVAP13_5NG110341 [Panicum virgatum]|uniref:Uncharacterized protein n=1 Tax=Panicum virgatum TaxID=38727 RepID=A0A8T0S5H3_PANVG|nr:hypothetical protein PVAP13_5NG110341 [Panicum virgatum]
MSNCFGVGSPSAQTHLFSFISDQTHLLQALGRVTHTIYTSRLVLHLKKLEEVGVRSLATADGDIDLRRRSPCLMKMMEARAPLEVRILKLKEEQDALIDRRDERLARENRELEAEALKHGLKVEEIHLAGAGKNHKAAEEVQPAGAAEDGQPAAGRKKRNNVVKTIVPQALVEYMILNPHNPFIGFREEKLGESPQWFHDFYDEQKAMADNMKEYQQILIKQYRTKGYAEDYTLAELTDEEDCTEVTGVEDCTDDKDN